MATILYEDAWAAVSLDPATGLVRYTRTALPYGDLADMERSFAGVESVAARVTPAMKLLVDLRLAPPRNDRAFEGRSLGVLQAFARRFGGMATLVRTAVGKLQTARLAKERGAEANVFDDEAAALAFLVG